MRHFKDFLSAWHILHENIESPPQFKLWSAISILAGAIERKLWINTGSGTHYCNLYTFLIGERSTGKSFMSNIAVGMLENVPDIAMAANKLNEATFIRKLIRIGQERRFNFQGESYPNSSVFIYASEAASTFKEMHMNGSIVELLTDLFNCNDRPWSTKSYWAKETISQGPQPVFNPCINLLACSTPAWLMTKVMKEKDIDGGFGSRVLMVVLRGTYERKLGIVVDTAEKELLRLKVMEELKHIARLAGPYSIDPGWTDANAHYLKLHNQRMRELAIKDRIFAACIARKVDSFLPKLSMILAANERNELVLREKDAHAAWDLLSALEVDLPYAFTTFGVAEEVKHVQDIWLYMNEHPAFALSLQELCLVFAKKYSGRRISEGLYDLCKQGRVARDGVMFRLVEQSPEKPSLEHE